LKGSAGQQRCEAGWRRPCGRRGRAHSPAPPHAGCGPCGAAPGSPRWAVAPWRRDGGGAALARAGKCNADRCCPRTCTAHYRAARPRCEPPQERTGCLAEGTLPSVSYRRQLVAARCSAGSRECTREVRPPDFRQAVCATARGEPPRDPPRTRPRPSHAARGARGRSAASSPRARLQPAAAGRPEVTARALAPGGRWQPRRVPPRNHRNHSGDLEASATSR
jgi:hypothetical protein